MGLGSPCDPAGPNARIEPAQRYISRVKSPEYEKRHVLQYLAAQAPDEKVLHAEKVTKEVIYGQEHEVWDVHTDQNDWWVVTTPTNLYRKHMFPSMDMCLTFHIGLAARLFGKASEAEKADNQMLLPTLRRLDVVARALDDAKEVEDFQAVAMRCRECLLQLVRDMADSNMVSPGQDEPKLGDFPRWSTLIAAALAPGGSSERIRAYLGVTAEKTWSLVNSLTHSRSADRTKARLAHSATSNLVLAFCLLARDDETVGVCPGCGSNRLYKDYRDEHDDVLEVVLCMACGAEGPIKWMSEQ